MAKSGCFGCLRMVLGEFEALHDDDGDEEGGKVAGGTFLGQGHLVAT